MSCEDRTSKSQPPKKGGAITENLVVGMNEVRGKRQVARLRARFEMAMAIEPGDATAKAGTWRREHRASRMEVMVMGLKERYKEEIAPQMMKKYSYKNVMQIPGLTKIVVNMGVGEAIQNSKTLDAAVNDLATITGQRPIVTKARKSIAAFKLRAGMKIGCKVTLRGKRMYDFLEKLVGVVLPRLRDFRGVSPRAFDGRGNYTLGLREQMTFPEIDYDKIDKARGMDITVVTTAKTDEEARDLLRMVGMPFRES
jgi:large subunit ribosomal protein L5